MQTKAFLQPPSAQYPAGEATHLSHPFPPFLLPQNTSALVQNVETSVCYRVVLYPGFSPEKQEEPEYKVNAGLTDQELGSNIEPSKNLSRRQHIYNLGRQVRTSAPALYKQLSEPNNCGFGRMSAMNTDMSYEYFLPKIRCQFSQVSFFVAHWSLSQAPAQLPVACSTENRERAWYIFSRK